MNSSRKDRVIENTILILVDLIAIAVSYQMAFFIRFTKISATRKNTMLIVLGVIVLLSIFFHVLLQYGKGYLGRGQLKELFLCLTRGALLFISIGFIVYMFRWEKAYSRLFLAYFVGLNFVIGFVLRVLAKKFFLREFRKGRKGDRIALVTSSEDLSFISSQLKQNENWSQTVICTILTDEDPKVLEGKTVEICPDKDKVLDAIKKQIIDVVVIYRPSFSKEELKMLITDIQLMGTTVLFCPELPAQQLFKVGVSKISTVPAIRYYSLEYDYRLRLIKRIADIFFALIGLLITAVLTPFIALAIKIDSPGPVIFSQTRVSKNGRTFKLYKFRSMYRDAEARKKELLDKNQMQGAIFKIDNDPRITKVGKFLRKTSLDELPQFWNILMSDMSLVGTRPPTLDEYEQYDEYSRRRLSIRPGLTGLWQISGRSNITDFNEIVKLDLEYIDNWSLYLDLKIILKTVGVIFMRKGAE